MIDLSSRLPLRLPSVFMGIVSWLLISREMLPRLGQQVRRSTAAGWAAAMFFLVFWLPYNNGLRPEPVCVISALLALCAVERAVATRRVTPLALGLVAATFALAATPTGLMAFAPFLAASLLGYVPQTLVFALLGSGVRVSEFAQLALGAALFLASMTLGFFLMRAGRRGISEAA